MELVKAFALKRKTCVLPKNKENWKNAVTTER
jgi:hypothetical protein